MKRLIAALLVVLSAGFGSPAQAAAPKVLRVVFPVPETGLDPAAVNDLYSHTVIAQILEPLYHYDHLARPVKIRPLTAVALPEVSDDFRTWTVRLRPGIRFADDAAFSGRPRELTAADYVYSIKRFADPASKSPVWGSLEEAGFVGLKAVRDQALRDKKPFDYDRDVEGLRALDRYTLQFRTAKPRPALLETLASSSFGAMAREVVDRYGADITAHPVGTGPFRLAQWRRGSLTVLERNPGYRDVRYDAEPAPDDAEGQALLARFKGRRLPMVDRVEISIIRESQPTWLSFLNGENDITGVPAEYVNQAMPNGKPAPNLAKRGIRGFRSLRPDVTYVYFNMEHPVVGGYTPEKVALRRALALAMDVNREIRVVRRGQAVPAQGPLAPQTIGYDPAFKSEMGDYDPARAQALLDLYGYVDKDGDGWRDMPDGTPLVLEVATQPGDPLTRQFDELWKKNMDAIHVRVAFRFGQWPEQLKAAHAGQLMLWSLGDTATAPDGQDALGRYDSKQAGGQNLARFKNAEMDRLYADMSALPDGPERRALFLQATKIAIAYMPYKYIVHRIGNTLVHPWLIGYRTPVFWQDWYRWVDIDAEAQARGRRH
jgi:ABC-type transport system substrate-binding protein